MNRFYCQKITQSKTLDITGDQIRHITKVMRSQIGDKLELFDGIGSLATATITAIAKKQISVAIDKIEFQKKRTRNQIIIAASISKGDRFDWLISKCTELGVDRIVPLIFQRTVKQSSNSKILDRWNNLAISAAKQCKRLYLPQIDLPTKFDTALENLKTDYPENLLLAGIISKDIKSLSQLNIEPEKDTIAFIGPEGGFTDDEQQKLLDSGAVPVSLADTVLRSETAAISFAANLSAMRL